MNHLDLDALSAALAAIGAAMPATINPYVALAGLVLMILGKGLHVYVQSHRANVNDPNVKGDTQEQAPPEKK
jgi:hypothetical protein